MANSTEIVSQLLAEECTQLISLIPTNSIYGILALTAAGLVAHIGQYFHVQAQVGGIASKCFNIETGNSSVSAGAGAAQAAAAPNASKN